MKNDKSDFVHDRYFRFAFAEPKRMAELLTIFSRHNATLKAFLDTIDLASLRGAKENFSSDKHVGSADLVFEVNLKAGGITGLYVGIIAEHKSTNKDDVLYQISEYYHHLFMECKKGYRAGTQEERNRKCCPRQENRGIFAFNRSSCGKYHRSTRYQVAQFLN